MKNNRITNDLKFLYQQNKGFTLIELLTVMSIIGTLVLQAVPKLNDKMDKARMTKETANIQALENAAEYYRLDKGYWPVLTGNASSAQDINKITNDVYDINGNKVNLDNDGKYYDIDYNELDEYVKFNNLDSEKFVLQSPVGKIYYLDTDGIFEDSKDSENNPKMSHKDWLKGTEENGYVKATDNDFVKRGNIYIYTGSDEYIIIPETIHGEKVTNYYQMFNKDSSPTVKGVASYNSNVIDMNHMFYNSPSTELELTYLDTSNVQNMEAMFWGSNVLTLDLSNFDTRNVTSMKWMFVYLKVKNLDLSSFDTRNVKSMGSMFLSSQIETLNIDNFNTHKVTDMTGMFGATKLTEINTAVLNTHNVIDMNSMFQSLTLASLDLSHFDTRKVTDMMHMFNGVVIDNLDLSSFDITHITDGYIRFIFKDAKINTVYVKNQEDATKLYNSEDKPAGLRIVVKE